jgi:serine protease Do
MIARLLGVLVGAGGVLLGSAAIAAPEAVTPGVFERFADAVVQIRIVDESSGTKSVIGSGFFVDRAGTIVTNYHVVARLIHDPGKYRAERVTRGGDTAVVDLLAIDVVHDLAVVRHPGDRPRRHLRMTTASFTKGTRLYSLGHPHDLGLSIVEGTYNGLLEHSLYDHIHFTGSINPGMSGGPTLTAGGAVVGVNVSSAGNQVSFLVPAAHVVALVAAAADVDEVPDAAAFVEDVRDQLLEHQDTYFDSLLADEPLPTLEMESLELPGELAPFIHCWGDHDDDADARYVLTTRQCSADDQIYLGEDKWSGVIDYRHEVIVGKDLNRFQVAELASARFGQGAWADGSEKTVTSFECQSGFVEHDGTVLKVAYCLRAYRKMPDLYDVVLRAAVLGGGTVAANTSLSLYGVGFDNARLLGERYLGAIAWIR